jgi:acyl-CoA thioesterase FadM
MTTLTTSAEPSVLHGRPAFEGANIRTWIGFKHFMYLVEQGVLQWLRDQGSTARDLYLDHGLGLEIVDCSVQLPAVLELDDDVKVEVGAGRGNKLAVTLSVVRDGAEVTVLRGKLSLALVRERTAPESKPAPERLAGLEVGELAEASTVAQPARRKLAGGETAESVLTAEPGSFLWSWRAPYFYCHYSDRVQHSGYVRALEEVVDRFLADRGISVGRMLTERSWIPVVSRARVQLIEAARMEEVIHTTFTVTDILLGTIFDGRMDCWVRRGDELVPVATAQILHGYAIAAGEGAGGMAKLDDDVIRVLRDGRS